MYSKDIGWNFDNTYSKLPEVLMTEINPIPVQNPKLTLLNNDLAKELDLDIRKEHDEYLALIFSGNILPKGSKSISQAYAGHQFGHLTILGDGRATLVGEHINKKNMRFDIQLKGSGRTPYSRSGDGRAGLGSMLREYLMSEAMHKLNIPTTRSLAVVTTGEDIIREKIIKGAILTRIASSHIRVGTFQYLMMKGDINTLKQLVNYTLNRHYVNFSKDENQAAVLLEKIIDKQISLIVNWMRVGFIHGVLNSDNISLAGETIDYGPCAFMDQYNPQTVFSSIDEQGRYSYANQEIICHWNVSRFAETLIPLLNDNQDKAIHIGSKIINEFPYKFKSKWTKMMKNKLGFVGDFSEDEIIIKKILNWMEVNKADYTNTFTHLINNNISLDKIYLNKSFRDIYEEWNKRICKNSISREKTFEIMKANNPLIIPRNQMVEEAIKDASEENNLNSFNKLLDLLKDPYGNNNITLKYLSPPNIEYTKNYKTFCGT